MVARLKNLFGITIIFLFFQNDIYAEQSYSIFLKNGEKVDNFTYEFDVTIKSNSGEFKLTSYQVSLVFGSELLTDINEVNFSFISQSSQLSNVPSSCLGVYNQHEKSILTFASLPGKDIITGDEKRIGRFILFSTLAFSGAEPNLEWNFNGNITTILTGENFSNITKKENHYNYLNSTTGVDLSSNNKSDENFLLGQNYPNPFNSTTTISFNIPNNGRLNLSIYNLLGETIFTVTDRQIEMGTHSFKWEGINYTGEEVPSGVYFYELTFSQTDQISTGKKIFKEVKKMLLLK